MPECADVFETDFRKKGLIRRNSLHFSLRPGNSGLQETLKFLSTASRRGAERRERSMLEKHASSSQPAGIQGAMALEAVRLRVAFDWPAHAALDRVTTLDVVGD